MEQLKGVQLSQLHQLSQQSYHQGVQLSQLHQPSQQSYPQGVQLSQLHQPSLQSYHQGVQLSQLHQPSQQSYHQGVQLSQLHQPSYGIYAKRAWRNAMPSYEFVGWCNVCSVGATLSRLVHLRQVHPLSAPLKDYLTSTFLTLPSAVRTMFRPFWSLESLTPSTENTSNSPSATVVALMPASGSFVQSLSTTLT